MSAANIFSISFGGFDLGGSTFYQLHNPYALSKTYDGFRMVFAVVITAPTHQELQIRSDSLETTFRRRLTFGDQLLINLNGSAWTYTVGQNLLKVTTQCEKSGDPASDKSFSRLYTVTIQAELPADNTFDSGLRNVEVLADNSPSNQTTVTVRGTYTALNGVDAVTNFTNKADADIAHYLTFIDSTAVFELVKEDFSADRERTGGTTPFPHVCNFTRQYVQLLVTQNVGLGGTNIDEPEIKDHRITFTEVGAFPGDGIPRLDRMRRVTGSYDCAVNTVVQTDLQAVFESKIRATVLQLFRDEFAPKVFCTEEFRTGYDESTKRISATFTFLYQAFGGQSILEVAYSVAYRETRSIDYTPTHQADELSAYADVGWGTLERIFTRRVMVLGLETPKIRIADTPEVNAAGLFTDVVTDEPGPDNRPGSQLHQSGWNMTSQTSEAVPSWIGDPTVPGGQLQVCTLTEQTVERFFRAPQRTVTRSGGPTTPSGGTVTPNG